MRFKAVELPHKPFIQWDSTDDPLGDLVVEQEDIPTFIYGVYTWKIVDGELVERDDPEMLAFQAEWEIANGLQSERVRLNDINLDKFTYDGNEFPMDEVSRLFYLTLEKTTPSSAKIRTMANTPYNLDIDDITAFMTAFYERLYTISKHTI